MVKKPVTWILVADGTRARILRNDGPGSGIYPVIDPDLEINLPSKVAEIVSDQAGRAAIPGNSRHNSLSPRSEPRANRELEFLRRVAEFLERKALSRSYDRLVLVAAPKALGHLRAGLAAHATALITREIDKDLVHHSERDLERHLLDSDVIL